MLHVHIFCILGTFVLQDDDLDMVGAGGGAAARKKFSRLSWGLEIWDLICFSVELLYEPELLVRLYFSYRLLSTVQRR